MPIPTPTQPNPPNPPPTHPPTHPARMDVTHTWRTAVSAAKRTGTGGPGSAGSTSTTPSLYATAATFSSAAASSAAAGPAGPSRGAVTDPFTQQAHEVLESIQAKEDLLRRGKGHYVDAHRYVPSRASDMTEAERDQMEQLMASFIIKCGSQIEIIRCALAGTWACGHGGLGDPAYSFIHHKPQRPVRWRRAAATPARWAGVARAWHITEASWCTWPR